MYDHAQPKARVGDDGHGDETGSSAYHGWVITRTKHGCHVLTEETQQGAFFLEELRLARAAEAEVMAKAG